MFQPIMLLLTLLLQGSQPKMVKKLEKVGGQKVATGEVCRGPWGAAAGGKGVY